MIATRMPPATSPPAPTPPSPEAGREAVNEALRAELARLKERARSAYRQGIPVEEDAFGRLQQVIRTLFRGVTPLPRYRTASLGSRVMPLNLVVEGASDRGVCLCVLNGSGSALTARLRNLRDLAQDGRA